MCILGIGALIGAWELNAQTKEVHSWMTANNIIAELDYLTSEVRLKQYAHVISDTNAEFEQHEAEIAALLEQINGLMDDYTATITSDTDRQLFEKAGEEWTLYLRATGEEFFKLSRAMKLDEANAIMLGSGYEAFVEFQEYFDQLLAFNHDGAEEANRYADEILKM